jgi:hypothetical protein
MVGAWCIVLRMRTSSTHLVLLLLDGLGYVRMRGVRVNEE